MASAEVDEASDSMSFACCLKQRLFELLGRAAPNWIFINSWGAPFCSTRPANQSPARTRFRVSKNRWLASGTHPHSSDHVQRTPDATLQAQTPHALCTTLKSLLLDRSKIPATPRQMRRAKAERIRESAAVDPFLGEGILDNPHICIT